MHLRRGRLSGKNAYTHTQIKLRFLYGKLKKKKTEKALVFGLQTGLPGDFWRDLGKQLPPLAGTGLIENLFRVEYLSDPKMETPTN